MPTKTRRQTHAEFIQQAYLFYWRFQNNHEYRELWEMFEKDPSTVHDQRWNKYPSALRPIGFEPNPKPLDLANYHSPIEFSKKIDWTSFVKNPDPEIIDTAIACDCFTSIMLAGLPHIWERCHSDNNLMPVLIDLRSDKKRIVHQLLRHIDLFREMNEIKPTNRHHANKNHLYAQVWDYRKGPYKKTFPEIGKLLRRPISTIKSRFGRAFEEIYGVPYEPTLLQRSRVLKESLLRTCQDCAERDNCEHLCPDVLPYYMQDEKKSLREKLLSNFNILLETYDPRLPWKQKVRHRKVD